MDQTNYGNYHAVVTPPLRYQLTDITGLSNENAAIEACACNTNSTLYESFEVWYSKSNSTWTCVTYSKLNYKPAQFQNPYSDVGQTYGYSEPFVPLKTCTPTLNYELVYENSHGSYAENLTNPGNSNPSVFPPVYKYYQHGPITYQNSDYINACKCDAEALQAGAQHGYYSFDMHFVSTG